MAWSGSMGAVLVVASCVGGCANRAVLDQFKKPTPLVVADNQWEDDARARQLARTVLREDGYVQFVRANVRTSTQRLETRSVLFVTRGGELRVGDERVDVAPDDTLLVPAGTPFASVSFRCVEALVVTPAGGLAELEIGACLPPDEQR